jgi:hypothetical protein
MSLKSLAWLPSPTLKRNGSAFGFNPFSTGCKTRRPFQVAFCSEHETRIFMTDYPPPALYGGFARAWIKSY